MSHTARSNGRSKDLLVRAVLLVTLSLLTATGCTSRLDSAEAKPAETKPAETKAGETKPAKKDDVSPALRELRDLAERAYDETESSYENSEVAAFEVYQASKRWLEQELAMIKSPDDKLKFHQAHLDRMRDLANFSLWRTSEVEYYVAEAEQTLDKLRPDPAFGPTILARQALQGEWEIVSADEDGAPVKKPDLKTLTVVGRRGEFVFRLGSVRALITIDPTANPPSFDVFGLNEAFPFGGHGIYKLDGDRLTVCWAVSGERPKQFVTKPGDDARLYVLKRAKAQEH
jgi:uncharacterized protein (TIGR03067 family)